MKQTENEIINILRLYLQNKGWTIESYRLNRDHGNDIVASKNNTKLIVEAKGAKAGDESPTKKRTHFDSGQIRTHFGVAIVKILEQKKINPQAKLAIAHPDDEYIRQIIGELIPFLKLLDITHFWVSADGSVIEE